MTAVQRKSLYSPPISDESDSLIEHKVSETKSVEYDAIEEGSEDKARNVVVADVETRDEMDTWQVGWDSNAAAVMRKVHVTV